MKILFLDIDGVVNCATTNFKTDLWPLDRYMAFLVGKILLDTGCQIVLSSTWRHHPEGVAIVEKHIGKVLDITPRGGEIRGEQIKAWLDSQSVKSDFFVEKYAILDDDSDMLEEQMPNFFKTSWQTGLTDEIANKVTEHLNVLS